MIFFLRVKNIVTIALDLTLHMDYLILMMNYLMLIDLGRKEKQINN